MRKSCPSDISRKRFAAIREYLEAARRKTALRKVDLYDVFCAVQCCTVRSAHGLARRPSEMAHGAFVLPDMEPGQ